MLLHHVKPKKRKNNVDEIILPEEPVFIILRQVFCVKESLFRINYKENDRNMTKSSRNYTTRFSLQGFDLFAII